LNLSETQSTQQGRLFLSSCLTTSQHSARASPSMSLTSSLPDQGVTISSRSLPKTVDRRLVKNEYFGCRCSRADQAPVAVTKDNKIPDLHCSTCSTPNLSKACGYPTPPLWRTGSQLSNQQLPRAGPIGSGGGENCSSTTRYSSTRLARQERCCDMHTPMSVMSVGLTSSGHPRPGSGGPTEPLRHRRLCIAGSGQHAP
jgi:hypothetical protein